VNSIGLSSAALLLAFSIVSCSRFESPEAAYRRAQSLFIGGNLDQAAAYASSNAGRWRSNPDSPWFWKFRLLEAEALAAESRNKDSEKLLGDPVPPLPALAQLEVRRLIDLAPLRSRSEAAEILRKASAAVTDPELEIRIRLSEGILASKEKDAGELSFRAALAIADRLGNSYWQANALSNLSYSSKFKQRYEESLDLGLRALTAAGKSGARRVAARAHGNLGSTYAYLGEFELALEHQGKAAEIFEAIGARSNLMTALGELGVLYDRQDQYPKALASYKHAFEIALDLDSKRDAARFAENLSLTCLKTKQLDAAEEWNRRASGLATQIDARDMAPYIERNRALIEFERGRLDDAALICGQLLGANRDQADIRWTIYDLLGQIDVSRNQFAKANEEFEAALNIIEGTRSDLTSPYRITLLSRLIPFYRDYVDALVRQNDDAGALRVVESSRARVLAERMGRNLKPEQFPNLPALKQLARSTNSSLLSFWFAPDRSFAWLVSASGVQRFSLPPAGEVEALVTRYREVVEHSLIDPIAAHDPSGASLWNKLLAEIAPQIPKGSRLIVVPDGPLHRLNLETMINPAPAPHYWIDDVEIAIAPSIAIAAYKPPAVPRHAQSLLLIGASDYSGTDYSPLPKAAGELHSIESHFAGSTQKVYTGAQACPAAYGQAGPAGFSLIHFAAHADSNAERPLESAIVLSPQNGQYKLYAHDVIDIPIHAGLVTISSCRSAGVRTYAGEGLIGFAWAFLQAGARDVVAGLWDVSDTSTEALMDRFYAGIASAEDPVSALRSAKLALLRGDVRHQKPFYWAPFQAYVGSAAR
jgi:CHAT domain-containing protein/tetratricopeptide (TPR) repeat protein